jgi:hypothetical protein
MCILDSSSIDTSHRWDQQLSPMWRGMLVGGRGGSHFWYMTWHNLLCTQWFIETRNAVLHGKPHVLPVIRWKDLVLQLRHGLHRKHCFHQFSDVAGYLPSDAPGIVNAFTGHCLAADVFPWSANLLSAIMLQYVYLIFIQAHEFVLMWPTRFFMHANARLQFLCSACNIPPLLSLSLSPSCSSRLCQPSLVSNPWHKYCCTVFLIV